MPVITLPDVAGELLAAFAFTALGVLIGALLVGVRERVILSTIGVAALHSVIAQILRVVLEGPYGLSPWISVGVSLLIMIVLVEIFFETGWPRSIGIAIVGLAVADWRMVFEVLRAVLR